jgi:predicted DNA-binding transcriptional regulator YafY
MSDPTLRQITLLQLLPRRGAGCTTEELRRRLDERGYGVSLRTVQRDLDRLSIQFPLVREGETAPRWRWMEGGPDLSIPAQDPYSALTWRLIEQHLEPLLPIALKREAEPRFAAARNYLEQLAGDRFSRWNDRVRIIPRAFSLRTPEVPEAVLAPVYEALFEGFQLEVEYRSRGRAECGKWRVHPLGLVLREGVIYLLVTIERFTDLRQLVAHRILSARVIEAPADEPEGFDLDAYIAAGGFSYVETGTIRLVLRVDAYAAEHLLESPIAGDQTARTLEDGRVEFTATVVDTKQLRWWLTGFGDALEVIEPRDLRKAMAEQAEAVAEMYRND